ncbi:MAG: DUF5674 family protein [Patescibacteria group bacterium]|nr:DUF5674 family protein [Patescibacteria group bacterium]
MTSNAIDNRFYFCYGIYMKIIDNKISLSELKEMSANMYGDLVKAVVDVKKEIMAVDAELHADEEKLLLEQGSSQSDLWGINLYLDLNGEDFLEFDSMINLRPSRNNRSRGVDDKDVRGKIRKIVNNLLDYGIPA